MKFKNYALLAILSILQGPISCSYGTYVVDSDNNVNHRDLNQDQPFQFSSSAHACLLAYDIVQCVGYNYYGQIGQSTSDAFGTPVLLNFPSSISAKPIKVVTGYDHTCTLFTDGHVWCNGSNGFQQLGNEGTVNSATPVQVKKNGVVLTNVIDIEAGAYHNCAIQNTGAVYCWGFNTDGQLGLNSLADGVDQARSIIMIALSMSATCAITELDATQVKCVGYGYSSSDNASTTIDLGHTVTAITAGSTHFCALLDTAKAKCWGTNHNGQLGIGSAEFTSAYISAPVFVLQDSTGTVLSGITKINAAYSSTCLLASGKPMCFGNNRYYQLGIANGGTNILYPTLVQIFDTITGKSLVSMHIGEYTGHAVFDDDSVYSVGTNNGGTFGDGSTISSNNIVGDASSSIAKQISFIVGSSRPSLVPSSSPTIVPTYSPTSSPSSSPTAIPTASPTKAPSSSPSAGPVTFHLPPNDPSMGDMIHAICLSRASHAIATSDYNTSYNGVLSYTSVLNFSNGQLGWDDRDYTLQNVDSTVCNGGIYLKPSNIVVRDAAAAISVSVLPSNGLDFDFCVIVSSDGRDGGWLNFLPTQGFTLQSGSLSTTLLAGNTELNLLCKTMTAMQDVETLTSLTDGGLDNTSGIECQGDCDFDSDCQGDLVCHQRGGTSYPYPPRCRGDIDLSTTHSDPQNYDWCVQANPIKLGLCEGECWTDADCDGNLICSYDTSVSCVGIGTSGWKYCVANQNQMILEGSAFLIDASNTNSYTGAGSNVLDLIGDVQGTFNGSTSFEASNIRSFVFNGNTDSIQFGNTGISLTSATFTCWVKRNGPDNNYTGLIMSRPNSAFIGQDVTGIGIMSNGNIWYFWNNVGYLHDSGLSVPLGQWTMLTVTIGAGEVKFYKNVATGISHSYNNSPTTITNLVIGDEIYANSERFFNGQIATAAIYNRALSDSEVAQLFHDSKARYGYSILSSSSSPQMNVALSSNGAIATQSNTSTEYGQRGASLAIDGSTNYHFKGGSVTHTGWHADPWWKVQLQREYTISNIIVYNRNDSCCWHTLNNFRLTVMYNNAVVFTYNDSALTAQAITTIPVEPDIIGDEVKIELFGDSRVITLAEVVVEVPAPAISPKMNVALSSNGAIATQSSTYNIFPRRRASFAIDGNTNGIFREGSVTHTNSETAPWWKVKLAREYSISTIVVYNRSDSCCIDRLKYFSLTVMSNNAVVFTYNDSASTAQVITTIPVEPNVIGDEVKIQTFNSEALNLAEVVVEASTSHNTVFISFQCQSIR
ncbi:hypothetical protein CTEN210_04060 [Chaetoceros tenuissimus]|uniref:Fucolectin tachylectin-4 pentraxin-1 domain-containing protein n=1 Tax=Chaetoceros tenuissimus TaxID=426638 RepID=A0AAD3H253_9STRA|nr:hypothetical protein CTEN210_04060 [Chaetoceros tenuissimus]